VIDFVTIATLGNATDFGDLTIAREGLAAVSSKIKGLWGGGSVSSNTIDYIQFATTANAQDFGYLTSGRSFLAACSNAHGGI
jgi:hypothetical protein